METRVLVSAAVLAALLCTAQVSGQAAPYSYTLLNQCQPYSAATAQYLACHVNLNTTIRIANFYDQVEAICSNSAALVTFYSCLKHMFEACLPSEYHSLLQTDVRMRDAYYYACNHRSEMNMSCMARTLGIDCARVVEGPYLVALNQTGVVPSVCSLMEALRECAYSMGTSCRNNNRDVFDSFWRKTYPPACAAGARGIAASFMLLGACAVLLNKVVTMY